ncbi:hypothetical protein [Adhaeribacter pallidiroseus]|uniref:Uncharacterized protein n=1 Tax=Adhaeribacter pallidiroseus TaxID=2072847 RepID=A0A369QH61_9BACT|nr:hypothetical protein [Adhaeribacter pallidiroseus]RDC63620.1 hypothetical protein AHMF7616_02225 [Adhaeribacter pallidiroseus]
MKKHINEESEELIPGLAQEAFKAAYKNAIASGQTVTVVRGSEIVEIGSDGHEKIIGKVKPGKKVIPGKSGFRIR